MSSVLKWLVQHKKKDADEIDEPDYPEEPDEKEFKTFAETYKIITFALSVGLMYPNPSTRVFRFIAICVVLVSVAPLATFILIDVYYSWLRKDVIEIIRHSTMVGPFLGGFLKMLFMVWLQDSAYAIICEINRDYALYNRVTEEYKAIARAAVQNCLRFSERWWMVTVLSCVVTFPLMAAVTTVYSQLFEAEPQRYMVHELNKPWDKNPEGKQESPYYEIMNAYQIYAATIYILNFLAYDGFYGLAINHACLKIQMYCKALEDAMKYETEQVYHRLVWVIEEQNRTYKYMENVQECFMMWLGVIFLATMIQLCNLLYHVSEGFGFDLRYMVFITGVTIHIYLPCHYAAKLKALSAESATLFYCSGWENVPHNGVRKALLFMIARAQIPQEIIAFNMITFDMELFVQILQTSYSMYTLLSS